MPGKRSRHPRKPSAKAAHKTSIIVDIPMIGKGSYTSDKRKKSGLTTVRAPVAQSTRRQQRSQQVTTNRHSETIEGHGILCQVNLNENSTVQQIYAINPGLQAIFPWISEQAKGFSKYKIRRLRFSYRASCSTTTSGNLTLFGDPNVTSLLPNSLTQAVSYEDAVTGPLWANSSLDIPCKGEVLYLRSGQVPPGQDVKTYDGYQFSWLVTGAPVGSDVIQQVGYIEVEYLIELIDRRTQITTTCECLSNTITASQSNIFECLNQDPLMGTPTYALYANESGDRKSVV